MDDLRFDVRVAVVTGAGRGIGRAYALLLAARGASVVVNDLGTSTAGDGSSTDIAADVVGEIEAGGGHAVGVNDSVATGKGAAAIVGATMDHFGRIDILINNAGNAIPRPFLELSDDDVRSLLSTHFYGAFNMCRAAWRPMAAAGYGRIVNTVSAAMLGVPEWSAYGAAKGAVLGLTLNLAAEGKPLGIHVNATAPAAATRMLTDTTEALPQAAVDRMMATMSPALVAPVAAYLAHESCALNGEIFTTSGGRVARITLSITPGIDDPQLDLEAAAEHIQQLMDTKETIRWSIQGQPDSLDSA